MSLNTNWIREELPKLKSAAERGNTLARVELAKRLLTGRGIARNPREAVSWLEAASASGSTEATRMLGHCYATGTGVSASGRKAYDLFVKAAFADDAVAIYNLAICFEHGMGVERDGAMAHRLYERASKLGYAKATNILISRIWNKDPDDTSSERRDAVLAWYAAQANKGDELARRNLALVRRNRKTRADKELEL